MELTCFDPAPYGFPRPGIPLLPQGPTATRLRSAPAQAGQSARFRHFTRGRYALGAAYRLAGLGPVSALLAPAYHCVTMLDPALALGADVQLYPLHADLSPDLDKLDELLAAHGRPVKALLGTHFFGLAQNFSDLKQWCEKHQIAFIEDCSHVLFTENYQAAGTGSFGKFVTASPYKFFACEDGGLLYSPEAPLPDSVGTKPAGLMQELRGIKRSLEKCWSAGSMAEDIAAIDGRLKALGTTPALVAEEQTTPYTEPSSLYTAAEAKTSALRSSRFIVRYSSIEENIRRRRNNYRRWVKGMEGQPNCRALFPNLPEDCAPYMFPLRIDHPAPHFFWLKQLGVPIWRWDQMAVSSCKVARDYRLHLLHLPCHQSLSDGQMAWMIAVVQEVLRQSITEPSQ